MNFNFSFKNYHLKSSTLFSKSKRTKVNNRFILFSDAPAGDEKIPDSFEREKIAKEIATTIHLSKGQMNFLIAGKWGIGKTSVLRLIKRNLKGVKHIWFSPWKYSGSSEGAVAISRSFMTILANELGKSYVAKDLYVKKQVVSERNVFTQIITLIPIIIRYLLYLAIIFLVLFSIRSFLLNVFPSISNPINNFLKERDPLAVLGIISAFLALPPLGQYFISKIREQGEIEKTSSPELFEIKFNELIDRTLRIKWLQMGLSFWEETLSKTFLSFLGKPLINLLFHKRDYSFLKQDKLVIFIDDLDRCNNKEVYEFLTGMKTFFEHPRVYYIIAADIEELRNKIHKEGLDEESGEYLRKIIQIDWNVPNLRRDEIKEFIKKLLKSANAFKTLEPYEDQIVTILGLNPSPRKIKYYLRRLLFLLNFEKGNK